MIEFACQTKKKHTIYIPIYISNFSYTTAHNRVTTRKRRTTLLVLNLEPYPVALAQALLTAVSTESTRQTSIGLYSQLEWKEIIKNLVDGGQARQSLVMCRTDERVVATAQMIRHHSS